MSGLFENIGVSTAFKIPSSYVAKAAPLPQSASWPGILPWFK
jgi:hypothetical protein